MTDPVNEARPLLVKEDLQLGYAYFCPACKRFLCQEDKICPFCGQQLDWTAEKGLYEGPVKWPTMEELQNSLRKFASREDLP